MNCISLSGNLGRDAELRHLSDGTEVLSFSVADSQGREKPTIWWACSLFGRRATALMPHLLKGQPVTVVGNVTEREWTDKAGSQRKSMEVRVTDIALQGCKPQDQAAPSRAPAPRPAAPAGGGFEDMDSDIPF